MMVNLFASTLQPGSYCILDNESHRHQKQSDSGLKKKQWNLRARYALKL